MLIIGICLSAVYKMMNHGKKMQNFETLVEKLVLLQNFFAYKRFAYKQSKKTYFKIIGFGFPKSLHISNLHLSGSDCN